MNEHKWCEPEQYPTGYGEKWTCPHCGRKYHSFKVRPEQVPASAYLPDSFGWTTADGAA
jgi:hypothetical protein